MLLLICVLWGLIEILTMTADPSHHLTEFLMHIEIMR